MAKMDAEVPVRLRTNELADKGLELALLLAERDGLVEDKKRKAKLAQEDIEALDVRISDLAKSLREGYENRRQGDLFADDQAAAAALAEVVQRAECSGCASGVYSPACPTHGIGGQATPAPEEYKGPLPTDPHPFVTRGKPLDGEHEDACEACGSNEADPVHGPADLGARPSKLEGMTNREALGAVADVVDKATGFVGVGAVLKGLGEQVFTGEPSVDPRIAADVDEALGPAEAVHTSAPEEG